MKKSLLIGINYKKAHEQNSNVSELYGCINDTLRIASLLMDAYNYNKNDITILRDDFQTKPEFLPTRDNILQNLNKIIEESKDLSEITIYYAGHGSSINDVGIKDEKDSKDEIIVPCDVMTNGYIIDDNIFSILKNAKCRVFVYIDACNSGTVADLQWKFQYINSELKRSVENKNYINNKEIYMFSGSRDDQTSWGIPNYEYNMMSGAFTSALIDCLRFNNHNVSILKLYIDICKWMEENNYPQRPCFSSTTSTPFYKYLKEQNTNSNLNHYSKTLVNSFYNK